MARDHVLMWRPTLVWTPRALRLACWAIGAISALLLTTGCVNGGTASPTTVASTRPGIAARTTVTAESPTTSTATSSTTGTAPFGVPIAARVDSVDGAVEFVKFAVAQVNLAYRTADPGPLDVVHAPECPSCAATRASVAQNAEKRIRAAGDVWAASFVMIDTWSPGAATVELHVLQNRVDLQDEQNRNIDVIEGGSFKFIITLAYRDGWKVSRWQPLK